MESLSYPQEEIERSRIYQTERKHLIANEQRFGM
jgi:hypothetical protein